MVVLGLAIAKYVSSSAANVGKVDLVFAIISGGVLYFIGWWEKYPGLQWYFEPDWQVQRRAMISCVIKPKDLIHKVISIYASELTYALLLIFQFPWILVLAGAPYPGEWTILDTIRLGTWVLFLFPVVMLFKSHPLTRFERIFLGITAVLYLYAGLYVAINKNRLSMSVILSLYHLVMACLFAVTTMRGTTMRGRTVWA